MHTFIQVMGVTFIILLILISAFIGLSYLAYKKDQKDGKLAATETGTDFDIEEIFDSVKGVKDHTKKTIIANDVGTAYVFGDYVKLAKIRTRIETILNEQKGAAV